MKIKYSRVLKFRKVGEVQEFYCDDCDFKTININTAYAHTTYKKKLGKCKKRKRHTLTVKLPNGNYKCLKCEKESKDKTELYRHINKAKKLGVECKTLSLGKKKMGRPKKHESNYCEICDRRYKYNKYLEKHFLTKIHKFNVQNSK